MILSKTLAIIGGLFAASIAITTFNPVSMIAGFTFVGICGHYEYLLNRDNARRNDKDA